MAKHKVTMSIAVAFTVDDNDDPRLLPYLAMGNVREVIEQKLPEGWLMKVRVLFIDDKQVENFLDG